MENCLYENSCTISQLHLPSSNRKKQNYFQHLSPAEKKLIEDNQVEVFFKKGENLAKQGSFSSYMLFLTKGLVKTFVENQHEKLILKIIPENNFIGLPILFEENNVFPYSVTAYIDSTAKLIDINIFKKIIKENNKFSYEIIKLLSLNTVLLYGRFFCFEKKQSYGRLADILLCISNNIYKNLEFELTLSRKELGELAGMSYESVIRILKKFKEDNLIEEQNNHIKIINKEKLAQISQLG